MHQHLHYRRPRRRTEKGPEKIFEETVAENFPNIGKETLTQFRKCRESQAGETRKEHVETRGNQIDQD